MNIRNTKQQTACAFRVLPMAAVVAGLLGCIGNAGAFSIDSDNPDVQMRWDQTLRYNMAWRMKGRDPGIANNLLYDEGDYLFDKNDMINNRVDVFSEFDFKYQNRMGFRISGQAWYDGEYGDGGKSRPGSTVAQQNIKNGVFSDETKRFYHGPSAEFLDHFVWINSKIGDSDVVARFGRHAVIWGESLVGNTQAVSYAQAPSDGRKGVSSPGASAKETALPVNQTTGTWQFLPNSSLSWQYQFEWKPNRLGLGGTYVAVDSISPVINGVPNISRANAEDGQKGAWGLMLKWHPEWVDADLGLIYRKFSDTNPWAAQLSAGLLTPGATGRYVYANDIKLWGLTFNKTIADIAVGAEISHRENMALNTLAAGVASANNAGPGSRFEGPIGDTWHAILNATAVFSSTPIWSSSSLAAELQYAGLDKVTKNAGFYKAKSNPAATTCVAGRDEVLNGCSTDDFWNFAVVFTPVWLQVYPGLDMSLGNTYVVGLKGTAPTNGGGNESSGQYKITLGFDYQFKHKLELAYTAFLGKKRYGLAGSSNPPTTSGGLPTKYTVGGGAFSDRDWLSLTYTYNF